MHKSKKVLMLLAVLIFSASNLFGQASATASVKVNLHKGLSIDFVNGEVDFGTIILDGTLKNETVDPQNGANFLVTGQPGRSVTISYLPSDFDNSAWAGSNGLSTSTLTFNPSVEETADESDYNSGTPTALANTGSDTRNLTNVSGVGFLNLWVGGSITIPAAQAHGDYVGTFTVSVAY